MRVLVISDIHGNLQALEAVLEAEGDRYDELWCLGDTVGYGARPNECVDLVRQRATVALAGNHDLAVLNRVNIERFGADAGRAARWTREVLGIEQQLWLSN
ncbi:MAG: metallophosphoesterase family protein, partial [Actinomycetota bacterium]